MNSDLPGFQGRGVVLKLDLLDLQRVAWAEGRALKLIWGAALWMGEKVEDIKASAEEGKTFPTLAFRLVFIFI